MTAPFVIAGTVVVAQAVGDQAQQSILDANFIVAGLVAVAAGLVSFASPCVIPLVPGYMSFMTGLTGEDLTDPTPGRVSRVLAGRRCSSWASRSRSSCSAQRSGS